MKRILVGEDLWREIRARAARSKRLVAVVGYLGRHPASVLKWPKRSSVICDLSRDCVSRGASSARGAKELLKKKIGIHSVRGLHAKIYIFDDSAIVSSANLSESSSRLDEAGVLITNSEELGQLRAFALRLRAASVPIDDAAYLTELAKLEPKRPAVSKPVSSSSKPTNAIPFFDNDAVWLQTCVADEDETREEAAKKNAKGKSLAKTHGVAKSQMAWLNECGLNTKRALCESDYVFFWGKPTSRAKKATFGYLDGPWISLGGVDLGKKFGNRRYCVPFARRKRRRIALDKPRLQALARVLGRKVPSDPAALWTALNEKTLATKLTSKAVQRMTRFLNRYSG